MSDSNSLLLSYFKEATYGVVPAVALNTLRTAGESLKQVTTTKISEELRADRFTSDLIRVGLSTAGDIKFELSYDAYVDFFKGAMLAATETVAGTSRNTTVSLTGPGTIADSGAGLTIATGYTVGRWVKLSGWNTAANNTLAQISARASDSSITVVGATLVTEAAGAAKTVQPIAETLAGTTFQSFGIEKKFTDLTNVFHQLSGQAIDGFDLNVSPQGIIGGAFHIIGKRMISAASTMGTGGQVAAGTNQILNAIDNVVAIVEGGAQLGCTNFTMQLKNNLAPRLQIGTLGAINLRTGSIEISGALEAYFSSVTLLDKYLNFSTPSSLSIIFRDAFGNAQIFDLPEIKFPDGDALATAKNGDVLCKLKYQAIVDPTQVQMLRMARAAGP